MRGRDEVVNENLDKFRITPARAGKSCGHDDGEIGGKDHPRACGEEPHGPGRPALLPGSPPRVRGRGSEILRNITDGGITPARAGKSNEHPRSHKTSGDHPRACGEEFEEEGDTTGTKGSPPRVRGRVGT